MLLLHTWLHYVTSKRVHISWIIAWYSLGILVGIVLAPHIYSTYFAGTHWLIIALAVTGLVCIIRRSVVAIALSCIAGCVLGMYAGAATLYSFTQYQPFYNTDQAVNGTVRDDVTTNNMSEQQVRLTNVSIDGNELDGYVWTSLSSTTSIQRGDTITITGHISEGFGTAQASIHSAELTHVVRPEPGDVALHARESFSQKVKTIVAEPQADLGVSFLAGQRTALPETMQDTFRDLGLIHLVVASGFHLTIVIRYSRRLFAKHSKYMATASSFLMMGGFLLLTGFSTSMIRASIVAGLSLLAWYVGRSIHPVVLLLSVAAVTALINPVFVWGDLAWHLSFAAFTGVIILAPLLQKYFWHPDKEPGFIRYVAIATLAAQIMTFPIIALTFEQYSPLALLANLLVLPLVPLVMLGTFLVGISGYLIPWLSHLLGTPTQLGLHYIISITEYLSSLPWATGSISISAPTVVASYAALLGLMFYLKKASGHSLRSENPID